MSDFTEETPEEVDALHNDLHDAFCALIAHAVYERRLSPAYVFKAGELVLHNLITVITGAPAHADHFFEMARRHRARVRIKGAGYIGPSGRAFHEAALRIHTDFHERCHMLMDIRPTHALKGASTRMGMCAEVVSWLHDQAPFVIAYAPLRPDGSVDIEDVKTIDNCRDMNQREALISGLAVTALGQRLEIAGTGGSA